MKTIGITGRSGCGKSAVTAHYAALGCPTVDADAVSRQILLPGSPCLAALCEVFGGDILTPDGQLRRRLLADRAFATPEGTQALTAITHPAIVGRLRAKAEQARRAGASLFFADGAVILGSPFEQDCDGILLVTAPYEQSVARICRRDGISPEMARRRLDAQPAEDWLRRFASIELRNDGTLETLLLRADAALAQLKIDFDTGCLPRRFGS